MSESRPSSGPTDRTPAVRSSLRLRRRENRSVWFVLSVCLHGLALGALLYLTPVREVVRQIVRQTRPQETMSARELENLAEAIQYRTADQIVRNTDELGRVLDEMAGIQDDVFRDFAAFDQQRRNTAAQDARQEMEHAIQQMESAVESIGKSAPIEQTDRFQALAEQAQERARRKLEMVPFDVGSAQDAHEKAEQSHQEAKSAHDADREAQARVATLEPALETEQSRAEQLRAQLDQMKQSAKPEDQIAQQTTQVEAQDQRVSEATQQLDTQRKERADLHGKAVETQTLAAAAQERAVEALNAAIEEHERAVALMPPGPPGAPTAGAGLPFPLPFGVEPAAAPPGAPQVTDVASLYEQARTSEDHIAAVFKEVRAMDLAKVRDMKLEDARNDIEVVRPVRPVLNVELLREAVRTDERFEAHKEEIEVALRETQSMVNLAYRMLEMATQSVEKMKFGADVGVEPEALETPDFQLIIRELAMEDVSGRFSDMAGMMQALEEREGGQEGEGEGGEEAEAGEGEGQAGAGGLRRAGFGPRGGAGGGLPLPQPGEAGRGYGAPPEIQPNIPAIGARKISGTGRPAQWMFIDSWYTLGPFPNPNRINIDREFPPDSLIDLDATYVGKDDRTIRWQFVQSEVPQIIPPNAEPYGIWYAYTEFHCDEPRDVLIATGTDDRGTLKINGVPVWISSKRLKSWDIDEVWRRVHFRQGINRILYRVENGWQHIGFSLVLRLEDQPGAQ